METFCRSVKPVSFRPRAYHKRPACSGTTKQCDELAPLHCLPQAEEMTAYHIEWSCCAVQQSRKADVRYGSQADMAQSNSDVCFASESGHSPTRSGCLLWARSGHQRRYSITLSARARKDSGIVTPSILAVPRLTYRSNFVGCSTGSSPGFVPFNILSTYPAARRKRSASLGP